MFWEFRDKVYEFLLSRVMLFAIVTSSRQDTPLSLAAQCRWTLPRGPTGHQQQDGDEARVAGSSPPEPAATSGRRTPRAIRNQGPLAGVAQHHQKFDAAGHLRAVSLDIGRIAFGRLHRVGRPPVEIFSMPASHWSADVKA